MSVDSTPQEVFPSWQAIEETGAGRVRCDLLHLR